MDVEIHPWQPVPLGQCPKISVTMTIIDGKARSILININTGEKIQFAGQCLLEIKTSDRATNKMRG